MLGTVNPFDVLDVLVVLVLVVADDDDDDADDDDVVVEFELIRPAELLVVSNVIFDMFLESVE